MLSIINKCLLDMRHRPEMTACSDVSVTAGLACLQGWACLRARGHERECERLGRPAGQGLRGGELGRARGRHQVRLAHAHQQRANEGAAIGRKQVDRHPGQDME